MPIPQSQRGNPLTTSNFEAPFETPVFPYGVGGLDLASPLDKIAVGRFARLTNLTTLPNTPGAYTVRAGLTEIVTGTGNFHSVQRVDDPAAGTHTYLWGVGTDLASGTTGVVTILQSGFSGDPLTMLPYHPPLSGAPWTFVADRSLMRKIRYDGLSLPIALTAPTVAPTVALGTLQQTAVAQFTAADGTEYTTWTPNAGQDTENNATLAPSGSNDASGSTFRVNPAAATLTGGFSCYSFWGRALTANLNQVGAVAASDDDIFHLSLAFANPAIIAEARIYVVVSSVFSPSVLPGEDAAVNADFYMKAFRPGDFAAQVQAGEPQVATARVSKDIAEREASLAEQAERRGFTEVADHAVQRVDTSFMASQDPARKASKQAAVATAAATIFGTIGIPLRRGDFARTGSTAGRDWSTVTGLIVYLRSEATDEGSAWVKWFAGPISQLAVSLGDFYLFGGSGPDTLDPATQSYDFRYTHYDPRTGDESNPSPVMADTAFIDALRRSLTVTPTAYGDANIRQRVYRRGGVLTADWHFDGENASDGGAFTASHTDLEIAAADTLVLDNFGPVPTVDAAGTTILDQPVYVLLGPVNGQLFALGDPYRPGYLYASKPGRPDHWPPSLQKEVCSPGEELMNGVVVGQILVWSRTACYVIYPNLLGSEGVTVMPAACTRGLAGRWACCTGEAGTAYFVATDGIFATVNGGPEDDLSADIKPLFRGQTVHGYLPIDFAIDNQLRLTFFQNELYFLYQDTGGAQICLVFTPQTRQWRSYQFADNLVMGYGDEIGNVLLFGLADRASTHTGLTDNGAAIAFTARMGSWDWGRPREEKLFGDQILDINTDGATLTLQNFLNTDAVTNPPQTIPATSGRARVILDSFGTDPQRGRNLAVEVRGSVSGARPILYQVGTSLTPQPDITMNRVTNWDDLGRADQSWVFGITLDADTGGEDRTIVFERDYQGTVTPLTTVVINHNGRSKQKYSWTGVPANQVRVRPDNTCGAWLCFRADWIAYPEPPAIAGWDSYFETGWDQYFTGLDLYCDTFGQPKTVVVTIDNVVITDPATGQPFFTVTANGKAVVHLTLPTIPPLRGHVRRIQATDAHPGLLYDVRWHTVEEPSEQANWNQPFTLLGTPADKYVKGVLFEVDTFGQDKTVAVEIDGVIATSLTVNTSGRKVQQIAFPQVLGRVIRILPTDSHPSRLYSATHIFDQEPYALDRWEFQETDFGVGGFFSLIEAQLTLKSTDDVTLTLYTHVNQTGTIVSDPYTIPATSGLKQMQFLPFVARKGVLSRAVFTSASPFWFYREESHLVLQPFIGGEARRVQVWGNDDLSVPTRSMISADLAAARGGGGTR